MADPNATPDPATTRVADLRGILNESIKKVPINVYALGVVGVVAAASLSILMAGGNWLVALASGSAMFVGMVVLRILSSPAAYEKGKRPHSAQTLTLTWICLIAFVVVLALLLGKLYLTLFPQSKTAETKASVSQLQADTTSAQKPSGTGSQPQSSRLPERSPTRDSSPTGRDASSISTTSVKSQVVSVPDDSTESAMGDRVFVSVSGIRYDGEPLRHRVNFRVGGGGTSVALLNKEVGTVVAFQAFRVRVSRIDALHAEFVVTEAGQTRKSNTSSTGAATLAKTSSHGTEGTDHVGESNGPDEPLQTGNSSGVKSPGTHLGQALHSAGSIATNAQTGLKITDDAGSPVAGAEVLLIRGNGVHLDRKITREDGNVSWSAVPSGETFNVFCAREGFKPFHSDALPENGVVHLERRPDGGSIIFAEGRGYLPGLTGRLDPIRDSQNRTYIYAENIAIDGGKLQPVNFTLGQVLRLQDSQERSLNVEIEAIIGSCSLIGYSRAGNP